MKQNHEQGVWRLGWCRITRLPKPALPLHFQGQVWSWVSRKEWLSRPSAASQGSHAEGNSASSTAFSISAQSFLQSPPEGAQPLPKGTGRGGQRVTAEVAACSTRRKSIHLTSMGETHLTWTSPPSNLTDPREETASNHDEACFARGKSAAQPTLPAGEHTAPMDTPQALLPNPKSSLCGG